MRQNSEIKVLISNRLLARNFDRGAARAIVADTVEMVLSEWRARQ